MKLIGFTGVAGSGKDTAADYLWERYGFLKMSFADPLKRAASQIFGIKLELLYDRDKKEEVIDFWKMSPRQILQVLGTEAVKPHFGADIWIKRFLLSYSVVCKTDDVAIPDVRFNLEAEALRGMGGTVVHIVRPGAGLTGAAAQHASEAGVIVAPEDYVIHNDGTVEDLYEKLEGLLAALGGEG